MYANDQLAFFGALTSVAALFVFQNNKIKENDMANLTIKRKKASGYVLQDKIKITIDDETIIEIPPNDSNTITLPNGNHKINFYYYKSVNLPIIGTTELKINETHDFSILNDTVIEISISNAKLKIQENHTKIKTKSSIMSDFKFGKWNMFDLYKFTGIICLLFLPLWLGISIMFITWNFVATISCIINGIFLISIPLGLYFWCKNCELKKFYDKKHIILSSSYFVIVTALTFFLPFNIQFTIISSIIALIVLCISIIRNTSLHYEKIIAVALILALLLSFLFSLIETSNNSDPDGVDGWTQCYKCNKTGKVRNDLGYYVTCPRCDGVGYLPD